MTTVVVHHDINKDLSHWLSSPKRKEALEPIGVTNIRTFVDPRDPKHVALVFDVSDLDALNALMQTKVISDAAEHDGVVRSSMRLLVQS